MTESASILVHIVGAGSGNPDLLTVKAHRLITNWAEIVVYDRLIPDEILNLIPDDVEMVYAGKSCKKHEMTQEQINQELLKQEKLGKKTLRLKGGDPFIFGRGGEEAEYLANNGIKFEITAGISAASGISAHLGIPLTHRGLATGVQFITGHQQNGAESNLDWQGLAHEDTTLVVYMGLTNLGNICQRLIEHGLAETTPAIAVENGTTKNERICFGNISTLPQQVKDKQIKPPTIIIIGKVVEYYQSIKLQ